MAASSRSAPSAKSVLMVPVHWPSIRGCVQPHSSPQNQTSALVFMHRESTT